MDLITFPIRVFKLLEVDTVVREYKRPMSDFTTKVNNELNKIQLLMRLVASIRNTRWEI